MPTLVLMRHGATVWGEENRFAGWADTPLSESGAAEARAAGAALAKAGFAFDVCFTSRLIRARQSLDLALEPIGPPAPPVAVDWRLNERHYGALQGERRFAMVTRYGNERVAAWRGTYRACPPPLEDDDPRWSEQLARLPEIPPERQPRAESLAQAAERVAPVWGERIAPALRSGHCVLVVAHTSAIRGLARAIEGLDDAACAAFRIATAIPRVYELDEALAPVARTDLDQGLGAGLRYWANRLKPRRIGWI